MGLPKLTTDRINARLIQTSRMILCVGVVNGVKNKTKWQCLICKQTWSSSPHVVIACKHGCPHCQHMTSKNIDKRLKPLFIKRLDVVSKIRDKSKFKCLKCEYVWLTNSNSILNGKTGCPSCSGKQRLTNDIVDIRLQKLKLPVIRLGNVVTAHTKIQWKCNKDHSWMATPVSIMSHKTGCPVCYSEQGGRGAPVTRNGIWFRSTLEANTYSELLKYFDANQIITQKRYNNKTRHTCDFYIPHLQSWIEVSNYSDTTYMKNIRKKQDWVKKLGESFFFISSPIQVRDIIV